ncbi:MAG: hypothetical protein M3437_02060 [Chloroflexota bacterium]|nr:hypothetical protein [Chloroflexota bacterium]
MQVWLSWHRLVLQVVPSGRFWVSQVPVAGTHTLTWQGLESVGHARHLPPHSSLPDRHSHLHVAWLNTSPVVGSQTLETQALLHTTWPLGHSHLQVVWLTTSPVLVQVTHWLPAGHSVLPVGQPHILPLPFGFLIHRREQHWVLAVHLLKGCLHAAQAAPGMEASVTPTSAAPTIRSALPLERVPVASPLARSSKEDASVASGLVWSS